MGVCFPVRSGLDKRNVAAAVKEARSTSPARDYEEILDKPFRAACLGLTQNETNRWPSMILLSGRGRRVGVAGEHQIVCVVIRSKRDVLR
jgi:hypothetical protein